MRTRVLVMVVLAALGATACGSSSKTADAPSGTTTPAGSDTLPGGDPTTTVAPDGGGGGGGGGDFCDDLEKQADALDTEGLLTGKSGDEIKDIYADVVDRLDDVASKAPDAIKSDVETVNDGIKTLVGVLEDVDYDFLKLTPEAFNALSDPKFETASQNIETYLTETCGVTAGT